MSESKPKLRAVESRWVEHQGKPALLLREPLGLSDKSLLVPAGIALLLALCDGTRDLQTLRASFVLRTGVQLSPQQVEQAIGQLDDALLLESARFDEAREQAIAAFRAAPYRPPALAGKSYPADAVELGALFARFAASARDGGAAPPADDAVCAVISPHIDYQRGGTVYAKAWLPVAAAARRAEVVIILGTDHAGMPGQLTLTRQHYATPWGVLPTDQTIVDALSEALGEEDAFAAELNHRHEHSIELAAVWLHYLLGDARCALVPILCGSFQHFVAGEADPAEDERFGKAIAVLREAIAGRRALVVAAGDLAHVGPAFGDPVPLGALERSRLRLADEGLLAAASAASAASFLDLIRQEGDRRRICGLPPVYLMLRLLDGAKGAVTGYAQCPADAEGGSLVSVAAAVFRRSPPDASAD